MNDEMLMNIKEYWEDRFASGSWEAWNGEEQSAFFSQLAATSFPAWLTSQLMRNSWEVSDLGCAAGGGTAKLAQLFPRCKFTGVDFSPSAVEQARKNHPHCSFRVGDITEPMEETDVVFSSNVLEHLKEPYARLEQMVVSARHHAIILVPLHDQYNIEEHFFTFGEEFFPLQIGKYAMSYFKIIDCGQLSGSCWQGEQLLLVYSNTELYSQETRVLAELSNNSEYIRLKAQVEEVQKELLEANAQILELSNMKDQLQTSLLAERDLTQNLQTEKDASLRELQVAKELLQADKAASARILELEKAALERALGLEKAAFTRTLEMEKEASAHALEMEKEASAHALEMEKAASAHALENERVAFAQTLAAEKNRSLKALEEERLASAQDMETLKTRLEEARATAEEMLQQTKENAQETLRDTVETMEAEKNMIEATLRSEKLKAAREREQMHRVNQQLEKTIAEKDAALRELNERIAGLEAEQGSRDQKIVDLTNQTSQLSNQINVLASQRNAALNQLQSMLQSRLFKLVHFINRFAKQGFHEDRAERKLFQKWVSSRFRKTPDRDHRYNPLFTVINALGGEQQVQQLVVPKPAQVRVTETVAAQEGQLKKHLAQQGAMLDEALAGPMSEEARHLREVIETREYKGIIIYPHVVYWEPLQTPQQLLRSFAHEGWLCLFCESPYMDNVCREVEPNLFITYEKDVLQAIGDTPVTVFLTWMGSMYFVDRIPNRKIWYHILDHLEIFSYYDHYYQALHDNIINNVDVVSYVAEPLTVCCGDRKDTVYLPNGVHVRDITEKIHPDFVPNDLAPILARGHKIVGYYGYLAEWMDYEMVRFLAESRPEYEFVFIGKAVHDTSRIDSLPNVHLLGLKPYKDLFDYAKYFDVATIPFLVDEKMDCVSPIKFYEYMALGLPVVSSAMKEMYQFSDLHSFVDCATNSKEFLACLDHAMQDDIREAARVKAPIIARENSWDARVRHISPMLSDRDLSILHEPYVKPDIIVLGIIDYSFRHQRPQHLAQRLARNGHRVFYINADFKNAYSATKLEENLWEIDLPGDATEASIHLTDRSKKFDDLSRNLDRLVSDFFVRDGVVIVDYPNWVYAAEYMRDQYGFRVITDYMDDYTGFVNPSAVLVRKNCIKLLEMSDSVIASSRFLYEVAVKYNSKVSISRNGTEYDYFHGAANAEKEMKDRPVIGYYGAIAEWFAADIVCRCAERFPNCDVVLVGAVTAHREKLEKHKNIKLIGEVPYSELLPWLETFDVCLIPFDTSTNLIKATNPVKFYEYLSAGKKIVATEIPELKPYANQYVYLENNADRFCNRVKACLTGTDKLATPESCFKFASKNDWNCRAADFEREIYRSFPKVSVVVLCYNQLDYTKQCVESILSTTAYPNYELILVDNNSQDQTAEYLKEVAEQYSNVKIVLNQTNRGFAGGNNDGLAVADGEYLVLLNNDTVVTRGWLTGLVKHFRGEEPVGLVGPVTNSIGNEAKIPTYYYQIGEMPAFAFQYTQEHMGEEYPHQGVLAMYCLMISRECYEKVGPLDENYGIGMFEDDDYSYAARHHGFRAVMAEDVFIHHYGSVSFKALENKTYSELHKKNRLYFEKKWKQKRELPKLRDQY